MELPPFDLPGLLGPTELNRCPSRSYLASVWRCQRGGRHEQGAKRVRLVCARFLIGPGGFLSPGIRQCLSKDWFSAARCSTVPTAPNWSERRRSNAGTVGEFRRGPIVVAFALHAQDRPVNVYGFGTRIRSLRNPVLQSWRRVAQSAHYTFPLRTVFVDNPFRNFGCNYPHVFECGELRHLRRS